MPEDSQNICNELKSTVVCCEWLLQWFTELYMGISWVTSFLIVWFTDIYFSHNESILDLWISYQDLLNNYKGDPHLEEAKSPKAHHYADCTKLFSILIIQSSMSSISTCLPIDWTSHTTCASMLMRLIGFLD
jgi:hypothetical protein